MSSRRGIAGASIAGEGENRLPDLKKWGSGRNFLPRGLGIKFQRRRCSRSPGRPTAARPDSEGRPRPSRRAGSGRRGSASSAAPRDAGSGRTGRRARRRPCDRPRKWTFGGVPWRHVMGQSGTSKAGESVGAGRPCGRKKAARTARETTPRCPRPVLRPGSRPVRRAAVRRIKRLASVMRTTRVYEAKQGLTRRGRPRPRPRQGA